MFHRTRTIAGAAVLALTMGGLAACAAPASNGAGSDECAPSDGKVTLTYWSWIPNIDDVVAEFNASHPDIQVEASSIVGDEAYQNYFNALKAGKAPDVGQMEYDRIPEFRAGDHLQNIVNCEPVADLADRVVPWTYNQVSLGTDSLYATPTDIGTLGLYYRTDIFEQYGLGTPTTWDEYMAAAEKLKAANPSISITSFAPQDTSTLQGLVWQAGATPYTYSDDSFVLDMKSEAMNKVADYWQQMIDKGFVDTAATPFSPALYAGWNDGTIASYIGPSWMDFLLQPNAANTAGKWGVLPLPAWEKGQASGGNWGGGGTAVFAGTEHPYEAAVFADWLSTSSEANEAMFSTGGQSASLAWAESGAYDKPIPFYNDQPIFSVFAESADATDTSFQWAPDQTNLNGYLQDALSGAFDGSSTIKDAFATTQSKVAADLESLSIPVEEK